jgi:NitT/TauT family transport system permease protein
MAITQNERLDSPARKPRTLSVTLSQRKSGLIWVSAGRLAVLAALLAGWQFLPKIGFLSSRFRFLDPFFISSPSKAIAVIYDFIIGSGGHPMIWPYLWETVRGALEGMIIGSLLGFIFGLLMSSVPRLYDVFGPYIHAVNAIPRIALVPLVIAVAGTGNAAEVLTVVLMVFFIMFFNCLEGGRRVPPAVLDNAKVLGASRLRTMMRIRIRYVSLWAFASVPNAMAFSILGVIFVEILAGTGGVGQLMLVATNNIDTTSNIGLIVFLSVTGVILVRLGELVRRRSLRWVEEQTTS